MKEYIYAPYVMERTVHDLRVGDLMRITHLNLAFGHVKEDRVTVEHLQYLDRIAIYKRINPKLQVILSIGGWGADGFSQAAATDHGRADFVRTSMEIMEKWDFDGVDIDWEYPCSDQAGIAYSPDDKHNFTLLMQELRAGLDALGERLGKKLLLTCAVGGGEYFVEGTEMDLVAQAADYINLMTYDLRGGFAKCAGHHTNLYPQTGDEDGPCGLKTVEMFHDAGVPYEKMVLGAAFYGRRWKGVEAGLTHGLGQPAETVGGFGGGFDLQDANTALTRGFTRYWDPQAQAAWLWDGHDFISYEDPESLRAKCQFVKEKGLAGLMYWAYGDHTLFEIPAHELMGFPLPDREEH